MDERGLRGKQVGHYLLMSPLGFGAGGAVYCAVDVTLHNSPTYAIKCVPESSNPRRRQQQIAEISNQDAVALCPNVLVLCDVFKDDRCFFLVSPLCEMDMSIAIFGRRLYWRNDALIKKAFIEVLDGVFSCHRKGIFHRDLKPENIMCDTDGTRIKIGDFGLSTDRRLCRDGGCGTVAYMSPECLDERVYCYDANLADIWSLGVILFNMVTHHHPWEEARLTDRGFMAFLSVKDHFLRTSPISESLSVLLRQMLHPIPMKRMSIPGIRQAIVKMDTFYGPPRSLHGASPLSKQVVVSVDSEETCVNPIGYEKKNKPCAPMDALEDSILSRLELKVL